MNCLSWERFDMLNSSFGIQHQFNSKTQFSFSEYKKAIWETEIRFLNLDQRFPNPKRLKSMPSVYHFGQFLIKQISSAFLLLSLLKPFLTLNLLLFCCNCFSPCLIYIVKARLAVFVYSDFLLTFSLCHYAQIFTFSINFLEFFKNNLKSKHKAEYDIGLQQQPLYVFDFSRYFKINQNGFVCKDCWWR